MELPYEIHITVSIDTGLNDEFIKKFKASCVDLCVKPIVLDLEAKDGNNLKDVMTSSKIIGNIKSVFQEINRIKYGLESCGFSIVREKIESVPWHPAAPSKQEDIMPANCYFESHIGCAISNSEKNILDKLAKQAGAHLSRNAFKKLEAGRFINMLTLRNYNCTSDDFKKEVENLKILLSQYNIEFQKVEIEFCLYDTKINHDYLWLK